MSQDQTAGRSHNTKIENSSLERVEQFKYFQRTITDQNFIQEEIKNGLKSGNACCHSVQQICLPVCYPKI
jgi:coproporphyrinogen III oxidase-like Fe-S oxidoreductase